MEKKKVKKQVMIPMEQEVDVFVTSDEKQFYNELEAKIHQERLDAKAKFELIPSKEFDFILSAPRTWYLLSDIEDLFVIEYLLGGKYLKRMYDIKKLQFPNWYLIEQDEDSHRIYLHIASVVDVREQLEKVLLELNTLNMFTNS